MKLDLKPVGKIVHNFADCLWITRQVGGSAAGGRRRGKEAEGDEFLLHDLIYGESHAKSAGTTSDSFVHERNALLGVSCQPSMTAPDSMRFKA